MVFSNKRITWQGRKDCEQNTAICGYEVEVQEFERIFWETTREECTYRYPDDVNLGTKNVGINGIKFKCCPIGE